MSSDYLTRVRAALLDLPPAETTVLLRRAEIGVAQAAAEVGISRLYARLGSPEMYARQLRVDAGYAESESGPAAAPANAMEAIGPARLALLGLAVSAVGGLLLGIALTTSSAQLLLLLGAVTALGVGLTVPQIRRGAAGVRAVAELPEVSGLLPYLSLDDSTVPRIVLNYVLSLQPAWWLVRAVVPMLLLAGFTGRGLGLIALAASVPAAVASVGIGRKIKMDLQWLWVIVPVNAFITGLILRQLI